MDNKLHQYHWRDREVDWPLYYSLYLYGQKTDDPRSVYLMSDYQGKQNKWEISYNTPIPPGLIVVQHMDYLYKVVSDISTTHKWVKVDDRDCDISDIVQEEANRIQAIPRPSIDTDTHIYVPKNLLAEWVRHPGEYLWHVIDKYLPHERGGNKNKK